MELGISRNLAELTRGTEVTVNAVMPGPAPKASRSSSRRCIPISRRRRPDANSFRKNRPTSILQRLRDPKEIADFVAFMVSPLASGINGAALRVDGGIVRSVF